MTDKDWINKETCWYFRLINMNTHKYCADRFTLENCEKVINLTFNGEPYCICVFSEDYSGLLYKTAEEYREEDMEVPYPVKETWDGWEELENDYYMIIHFRFKNWFRPQAFLQESELKRYIEVELPKIFEKIADWDF